MQWETTEQFQWGWQYNKVKYIKKKKKSSGFCMECITEGKIEYGGNKDSIASNWWEVMVLSRRMEAVDGFKTYCRVGLMVIADLIWIIMI